LCKGLIFIGFIDFESSIGFFYSSCFKFSVYFFPSCFLKFYEFLLNALVAFSWNDSDWSDTQGDIYIIGVFSKFSASFIYSSVNLGVSFLNFIHLFLPRQLGFAFSNPFYDTLLQLLFNEDSSSSDMTISFVGFISYTFSAKVLSSLYF